MRKAILYESEIKVMECLWERGPLSASELVPVLAEQVGWNKNTTYTVIKKLITKGFIERVEPGFLCRTLISREEVEKAHTSELVDKFYGGSNLMFLSSFVRSQGMSPKELNELRSFINNWSKGGD